MPKPHHADLSAILADLDMTPRELIVLLHRLGDPASPATIGRRVHRWLNGTTALPGEMVAFLALLARLKAATAGLVGVLPRTAE